MGESLAVDDAFDDPHKMDGEVREEKLAIFLSDPEMTVQIFLVLHARTRSHLVSAIPSPIACLYCLILHLFPCVGFLGKRSLVHMPCLIAFFLAFVLRNWVLRSARLEEITRPEIWSESCGPVVDPNGRGPSPTRSPAQDGSRMTRSRTALRCSWSLRLQRHSQSCLVLGLGRC